MKGFKTVFHGKERRKRKYIIEVERGVQAHEIWGIGVVRIKEKILAPLSGDGLIVRKKY